MLCSLSSSLSTTGSMSQCLPLSITSRPNLSLTHLHACLVSSSFFPFTCYLILFLSCSNSINWNEALYFGAMWDCCFSPCFLRWVPIGYVKDKLSESLAGFPSEHRTGLSGLSYESTGPTPKVWHPDCVSHKIQTAPAKNRLSECQTRETYTSATWTFSHQPSAIYKIFS